MTVPLIKPYPLLKAHLIFVFILAGCSALAQDSLKKQEPEYGGANVVYAFPASYGLSATFELPLQSYQTVIRSSHDKTLVYSKALFTEWGLLVYHYPMNQTDGSIIWSIGLRFINSRNFQSGLAIGEGLMRTFYEGTVYKVAVDGSIKELSFFGRFYALTNLSYFFDWKAGSIKGRDCFFQIKPSFQLQYPYNNFIKAGLTLEAGFKLVAGSRNLLLRSKKKNLH